MVRRNDNVRAYERLVIVACFLCNLSQIPILFDNRIISIAYTACWVLTFVLCLASGAKPPIECLKLFIFFDIYCLLLYIFTGGYITSDLFRPINLSAFILLVGTLIGRFINRSKLKQISMAFILSAFIVAVYLYLNVFRGVDWAGAGAYLYASKNSAGQIFLTASILLLLLFWQEKKLLSASFILFFTVLIFIMKARASIVTLLIVLLYIIFFVVKKPTWKILLLILFTGAVVYVCVNPSLHKLVIDQTLLNNRDISDFSAVSSQRDIQYEYFANHFGEYWLIGTGGSYIECMPLAVLLSYGLIGGIPVLLLSLYPARVALKGVKIPEYNELCTLIVVLDIMMWFNGVFEEQSPFGPGVKCYFLWLLTGIFVGKIKYDQEELEYEQSW